MTVSRVIQNVLVNGQGFRASLAENIIDGELTLSTSAVTAFSFTVMDSRKLGLSAEAQQVFREGTTILWEGYAFGVNSYRTGGETDYPTVSVEATSDFARALMDETGGEHSGNADVSSWATGVIRAKGAVPVVQPGLGEREIERKADEGNGQKPESMWDTLTEMAKQVGAWLFEYDNKVVLARPSWLVEQSGVRRYKITWESWEDHTDALTAAPAYTWDKDQEDYNGQESLTIRAMDPGEGSTNPLTQVRPGDLVDFTGAGSPTDDPRWIVREVRHPLTTGVPVSITCWRPIDPPEIVPDSPEGEGGSSAGVPRGPLGAGGWQGVQLENASEIVKEGQRRKLPRLALELAVACAMGESTLRNIGYGDDIYGVTNPDGSLTTSIGLFQQQNSWGSRSERLTPSKSAGFFYDALVKTSYEATYRNGGSSASSASLAIHNVQINADPNHYARFWSDAQLVVRECIAAGEDGGSSSPKATGPLGKQIDSTMKSYEGRSIDVDGAYGAQCVDLAAQYIKDLKHIGMVQGNGVDYYNHPGLRSAFTPIAGFKNPRKGDIVSWSGGPYYNGGYGHVAIFSHMEGGTAWFLSQNPGPARLMPLSTAGINGMMRPKLGH